MHRDSTADAAGGPSASEAGFGLHLGDFQSCLKAREHLSLHRHDHFEIFFLMGGRGTHTNDFKNYSIQRGTMIFVSPGQIHGWTVPPTMVGKTISFTRDFFLPGSDGNQLLFELPFLFPSHCSPVLEVPRTGRSVIETRIAQLEHEFAARLPSRTAMLRSALQMLLIEAQRFYERPHEGASPVKSRAGSELTRRFQLLLEKNFATWSRSSDYARALGVTTGHLGEQVAQQTGHTVGVLIRDRRQLEARRLLAHSDLTVAEIAHQVGYEEASYFGRVFRRKEKLSPGQFRAKSQNQR